MLKNLLALGSGEMAARGLQAIALLLLTRRLSAESFGYFSLAAAITAYLTLLVQQGFDPITSRSVLQRKRDLRHAVEHILGLRLFLAAGVTVLVISYAATFGAADPIAWLLLIFCGMHASAAISLRWGFAVREQVGPLSSAVLISQTVFLGGVLLIDKPTQAAWAATAQVAGELLAGAFLWWRLARNFPGLRPRFARGFSSSVLAESFPVTLAMFLGTMIYNFDVVALRWLGRASEIGVYSATYRCITILGPLLLALQTTIYPTFARAFPDFAAIRKRVALLAVLSSAALASVACLFWGFAPTILNLLYGPQYTEGAVYLRVLAWVLPLQAARAVFRQVVYAWHGQHDDLRCLALGALTNALIDIAAIPAFGALGCAWSTLCAEAALLFAFLLSMRKRVQPGL